MIEKIKLKFKTKGNEALEHLYLKHVENVETLVIIYPGGNYTCERPLLHYLRKGALDQNYDILSISYGTCFLDLEFGPLLFEEIYFETNKAIEYCLKSYSYKKIILIGKSIGSVIIGKIRKEIDIKYKVKQIYLTPIKETIPYINLFSGLVFFGTKDRLFSQEMMNLISLDSKEEIHVIEGANHALELDENIANTIELHKQIVTICLGYLSE